LEILDCNALFGGIRSEEERYDPGDVLAMMDKAGISRALAASTIGCFANFVLANNETAEVCKEHGRLIPVGTIHPTSYTDAENEIEECRDRGFKAFRLYTEFYGADFDGAVMRDFFSQLEKYRMPLIVSASNLNLSINYLEGIARRAAEVCIPVIVLNVGAFGTAALIECAKRAPNLYFATRLLYINRGLEYIVETIGSERLVMGSGIPYHYPMQSLYYLQTVNIPESDRENILYKNLERVILHDRKGDFA